MGKKEESRAHAYNSQWGAEKRWRNILMIHRVQFENNCLKSNSVLRRRIQWPSIKWGNPGTQEMIDFLIQGKLILKVKEILAKKE